LALNSSSSSSYHHSYHHHHHQGAELFTGNTALVSTAWMEKKVSTANMMKNWFWSYSGNLVGELK